MPTYKTYFTTLNPNTIFGMVGRCGGGHNTIWEDWSPQGRRNRTAIIREFEDGMDRICGHYQKLEESILKEGMRNPVVVTCGLPVRRDVKYLPPEMRSADPKSLLLLESLQGGSRLWIAQKHNIPVPCIVNDWTGRFTHSPLTSVEEVMTLYKDKPSTVRFDPKLGLVEAFDQNKVGYHLGPEWKEDVIIHQRAPLWVGIMNKYGYYVDRLPPFVNDILLKAGVDQSRLKNAKRLVS